MEDINIELGKVVTPTDITANGGGITLKGTTDKTINWDSSTGSWASSENFSVATGKTYKINGTDVLSSTTLGSTVVSSSLTSVGTVTTGTWSGLFGAVSGANLTSLTAGNLTGTIPSAVLGNSTIYIGTTSVALNRSSVDLALTGISSITLSGSTSGTVEIIPTAITGTNTITLPAATGTVALTNNNLGVFASTTSAQLANVMSDETGSGALVFANTPTLVSPVLGTPLSGTMTNCTGLPIIAGTTGTLSVARGGTGAATLTGFVYGNGTGAFTASTAINGAQIGNSSPNTGAFTTLTASGNTTITSSTASTSSSTGALVVTGGLGVGGDIYTGGNLIISGDFTVNGTTTTVHSDNLELTDSLIYLATGNSANSVDIGFIGHFNNGLYQHTGLARHATDNSWYLFSGMTTEPDTVINPSDANFTIDTLRANIIGTIGVGTQNSGAFTGLTSNTSLVGSSANFTRFPNALSVISNTGVGIQQNESHNIGLIAEGVASNTLNTVYGIGVYGVGYTSSITRCGGVVGEGHVSASSDVGSAVGVRGYANDTHAGGLNIGLYGDATNGSSNYGLYLNNGDIYTATAKNWVMNGNISFTGAYSVAIPTLSLTNALSIANGGTGATSASAARIALSAAASGANNDITSLTGLTTALGVAYGGTGVTTSTGTGSVVLNTSPTFTTSILTDSTSFNLLNTTATTVDAFGAATTLTIGGATTAQTVNIANGAIVSGNTKTVNIANGGASGSTTIVNIGSDSNSTINMNGTVVYQNVSTSLTSDKVGQTVLSTVTQTAVDSWSSSVYRSAEYTIQITQDTSYYMTKILLIHDGSTVYMTEYGAVDTGGILASFDATISGGNAELLITMATAATATINLKRSVIVI